MPAGQIMWQELLSCNQTFACDMWKLMGHIEVMVSFVPVEIKSTIKWMLLGVHHNRQCQRAPSISMHEQEVAERCNGIYAFTK